MITYHCRQSDCIERVEMHSPHPEQSVASVIAKPGASVADLEAIRQALGAKGFSTLMDAQGGMPSIQVRGIDNPEKFLAALRATGKTGSAMVKDAAAGEKKKSSFGDKVRGKSFFLSAIFYDIGNLALMISGIQKGRHNITGKMAWNDWSELGIGASFAVGDVLMTVYDAQGNEELLAADQGLRKHLHKKGLEIPLADTLNPDMVHQTGIVKATDRWLRKNIVHIKCLTEFIGGLFTIHSAVKPGSRNNGKLAAGLLITTGWLSTFLLEKPRGSEVFKDTNSTVMPDAIENIVPQPVLDNPRGWVARPAAMLNNVANLWGAWGERGEVKTEISNIQAALAKPTTNNRIANHMLRHSQNKQYDYQWSVYAACSFLIANSLFGLSGSKNRPHQTEDDKRVMDDLVLLSANTLAKMPEQARAAAIGETAEYVSKLNHMTLDRKALESAIRGKIDALTKSGWVDRVHAHHAPAAPHATL